MIVIPVFLPVSIFLEVIIVDAILVTSGTDNGCQGRFIVTFC